MRAKKAKAIRKLIKFNPNKPENKELEQKSEGTRYFGIIDGVNGNHRVEERSVFSMVTASEDKLLYKELKKVYKKKVPVEIYNQLVEDLGGQK